MLFDASGGLWVSYSLFLPMACSLQVNCGPDMKNTGSRLDHVVVSFLDDTLAAAVDPYFDPGTTYII